MDFFECYDNVKDDDFQRIAPRYPKVEAYVIDLLSGRIQKLATELGTDGIDEDRREELNDRLVEALLSYRRYRADEDQAQPLTSVRVLPDLCPRG